MKSVLLVTLALLAACTEPYDGLLFYFVVDGKPARNRITGTSAEPGVAVWPSAALPPNPITLQLASEPPLPPGSESVVFCGQPGALVRAICRAKLDTANAGPCRGPA